ncbi:hypothetical protein ABFA25_06090 [Mycobacterium lepromatosis]|uniref:hypothetical protein n=1 Tax=Mycobacterium lepromatosis TaxID=480418 RepID=UPI003D805C68
MLLASMFEQALFTRSYYRLRFIAMDFAHHSDTGDQYTAIAFTETLREAGIVDSIRRAGNAFDNV